MKLLHKTIMLAVLMALLSQAAQALPFVPTTDPESSSTEWYYLTTEGRLMVARSDIAVTTTVSTSTFAEQWCFVGTESSGYKIYNRQYKKYLGDNGYMLVDGDETIMYYKPRQLNTFYIWRYDALNQMDVYLYYDTVFDELISFFGEANESEGCFEATSVTSGSGLHRWTYYDLNNVGYRLIESGSNRNPDVNAYLMGDGDAATQFEGQKNYGYVVIEASQDVALESYSIVTANDARTNDIYLHSWSVSGSNDNVNYTNIDSHFYHPMPLANTEEVIFHVNDSQKYRYFKFVPYNTLTGSDMKLAEVWFNRRAHSWGYPQVEIEPTCGTRGQSVVTCEDCHVKKTVILEPTGRHSYVNGVCTECGKHINQTVLLCNGQDGIPYYIKFMAGYYSNNTWPDAPRGWNSVDFDDRSWDEIAMPTASYGHSGGPFTPLYFNSLWLGNNTSYAQNCRWFRRTFDLDRADPNATYYFDLVHDDNAQIYINGTMVVNAPGWTPEPSNGNWEWQNSSQRVTIPAFVFRPGKNVLAVYIQQTAGGAYFDCDLVMQREEVTGDVDGNGSVDGTDLNTLINIILGKDSADNYNGRANVDGQGGVDGNDLNALINILLGK